MKVLKTNLLMLVKKLCSLYCNMHTFFIFQNNTNLLHVHGKDCFKYALSLMDILFTKEEMASSCFYATGRSKKEALPQEKVQLVEGK